MMTKIDEQIVNQIHSRISVRLEEFRVKHGMPSIAVAGILGKQLVVNTATGFRHINKPDRVTLHDTYQLGSISKSFTATMIARLIEQGKMRWDSTIGNILIDIPMREEYKTVTLEMLLSHRSGFEVNSTAGFADRESARISYLKASLAKPRKQQVFLYSNVGYVAASIMAEIVTGKTWEDLIRSEIFEPLNMIGCEFGVGTDNDPFPHIWEGILWQKPIAKPFKENIGNSRAADGADHIRCPLSELAKYASAHLEGEAGHEVRFLQTTTWRRLHKDPFGDEYALGWTTTQRPWANGQVLIHNGSNTLNYAIMFLAPIRRIGIIVATNIGANWIGNLTLTTKLANDIGIMVKDELLVLTK